MVQWDQGKGKTYVSDVDASDTNTTIVAHTLNHLVKKLTGIRLRTKSNLNSMHPALRILSSRTLNSNIRAATTTHLLELADDGLLVGNTEGKLLVVDVIDLVLVLCGPVLADVGQTRLGVDEDDALGAFAESEDAGHLADGTGAPDCYFVVFVDCGVLGGVV